MFRSRVARSLFVAVLGALSLPPLFAQQPKVLAPHVPVAPRINPPIPSKMTSVRQSLVGGLWMTDNNMKASLYLKSGLKTDSLVITPVVYLSNGVRYALSPVNLEPSGTAIVDINEALASQGIAPYAQLYGYAEIEYQWPWAAVSATIKNVDAVNSLIFIYPLRQPHHPLATMASSPANNFEGLWWKQENDVSGFLSLANLTSQPITATVRLTDAAEGQLASYQVTVTPHGTKLLELSELKSTTASMGGIYVTHDGSEGALTINGALLDKAVGYSANLWVHRVAQAPPNAQTQAITDDTVAELGLMVGAADPMLNFPSGTVFTPYSFVRNTSEQPAYVTPTFWWMAAGTPQSANLPAMTVSPHRTVNLNVPALLATAGLKNLNGTVNLVLSTKALDGALALSSGSVDQKNTYVFEVAPAAVSETNARSICYWSTGNGDDTMITVWNPADEEQDFTFTLFYSGGHYAHPLPLGPRVARTFNISEILQSSIPDAEGNVVPAGVREGSAELAGSLGENQHILVSVDGGIYNVRKAICGIICVNCPGYVSYGIDLDPFAVAVGNSTHETFYGQNSSGSQYNLTGSATWSSSNASIATVTAGLVQGVSAGSPTIYAGFVETVPGEACVAAGDPLRCETINVNESAPGDVKPVITSISPTLLNAGDAKKALTINGSGFGSSPTVQLPSGVTLDPSNITVESETQIYYSAVDVAASTYIGPNNITVTANGQTSAPFPFTIDGPDHLLVTNDVIGMCSGCKTTVKRTMTYQVIKFSGSSASVVPIGEVIGTSGWNCNQANPGFQSTPCAEGEDTEPDGTFVDGWTLSGDSYTPAGCGINVVDHWQWCSAPKTIGSPTGYCHTDQIEINGSVRPPGAALNGSSIYP